MKNTIVFSDIDGTLLSSDLTITPQTLRAIRQLQARKIPFVIISARSPSGIYPILTAHGFSCPIVAYSGALALDENRQVLAHQGFSKAVAREMIDFMQQSAFDLSWNAFSFDDWVVASQADARVQREESIVHAQAREGSVDSFVQDVVHKILCICNPACTEEIERQMKARFPSYSIVRSSPILLEIMRQGVTKASAVRTVCAHYHTAPENAYAFGDNYNDEDMLRAVGHGYLMANAPEPLLRRLPLHTLDHNHDGIYAALREAGLVE